MRRQHVGGNARVGRLSLEFDTILVVRFWSANRQRKAAASGGVLGSGMKNSIGKVERRERLEFLAIVLVDLQGEPDAADSLAHRIRGIIAECDLDGNNARGQGRPLREFGFVLGVVETRLRGDSETFMRSEE